MANTWRLEEASGYWQLEDGSGYWILEEPAEPDPIRLNNFLAVRVGDGMGTTERTVL